MNYIKIVKRSKMLKINALIKNHSIFKFLAKTLKKKMHLFLKKMIKEAF